MQKFKKILYYGSVILPIINNIYKLAKFIIDFNQGNSEIIAARKDIVDNINLLKKYYEDALRQNDEFNKTM